MSKNQEKNVEILIQKGKEFFNQPYQKIEFAKQPQADELLNNLKSVMAHNFIRQLSKNQVK